MWNGCTRADFIYKYLTALYLNSCFISPLLFLNSENLFHFKMFSLYFPSYAILILTCSFLNSWSFCISISPFLVLLSDYIYKREFVAFEYYQKIKE